MHAIVFQYSQYIWYNKYYLFKVNWLLSGNAILKVLSGLGNNFKGGKRTVTIERIRSGASEVPGLFWEVVCDSREGRLRSMLFILFAMNKKIMEVLKQKNEWKEHYDRIVYGILVEEKRTLRGFRDTMKVFIIWRTVTETWGK